MNLPVDDFTLFPGEWYFGGEYPSVQTLLGSCVSVTVWHPILRIGGMCHYLLPESPIKRKEDQASWRYGVNALRKLASEMGKRAADRV